MTNCLNCGEEFTKKIPAQKFCSSKCKSKFYSQQLTKHICECCGKEFIWTKRKKIYCSDKCRNILWKKRISEWRLSQESKNKYVESCLKNLWVTNPSKLDTIKKKKQKTCIEHLWVANPSQSNMIKKKKEQTYLENLWVKNPSQSKQVQKKKIQTNRDKRWVDYPFQSKEVLNKSIATNMQKKGHPYNCMDENCKKASKMRSKENQKFEEYLLQKWFHIDEVDSCLENYLYDIKIQNTFIEWSPWPYHNLTFQPWKKPKNKIITNNCKRLEELQRKTREKTITKEEKKEKGEILKRRRIKENYHKDKTICARENGYRCITVFSWDDKEKIIYLLEDNKEKIYARKCEVKQITYEEAHQLFEAYHLQGDTQKNKNNLYIGLIYEWRLVMAISFGKPRYNKDYEWEILRLCTHKDYSIIWGASKIFKYFIELTNPNNVISYCDMGKFDWKVYEQMGFELLQWNFPSRHRWFRWITNPEKKKLEKELWYEIFIPNDKHIHFTDNQINLARGFDQLLWKYFGVFGKWTRNDELLRKFNYVEVYDCWQATYIWHKEKEEK